MKKKLTIKKITFFIFLAIIISISFLVYKSNENEKKVIETIKEISKAKKVKHTVSTILFTKSKDVENHITSLKNVLFYNENITVTQGGIIKGEFINKFYNSTEFKDITYNDSTLLIGYKNGFLLLKENYINHFNFNEIVKKCILNEDNLFCIKETEIIKKDNDDFIIYFSSKNKINDILYNNHKLYILTTKQLIIKDSYSEKKVSILNANKLISIANEIFIISDREIFKVKGDDIISFKKVSSIHDMVFKNNKIYYITMNGVIYNSKLKKEHTVNNLVNDITYLNNDIYILTQKGIYIWNTTVDKFKFNIINNTIKENYITNITKYDSENILISYFNSGVDLYNSKSSSISDFINGLNGVNDILLKDNAIYVATTNGLFVYDKKLLNSEFKYFDKKNGIIGTSVSQVKWYKDKIFVGSEGGISQKTGETFNSIYGLHGLVNNRVNSLKEVNGLLYVGTLGGVSVLNGLKVTKTLNNKNFRAKWITGIESVNNIIYISTYGGGIYSQENDEIRELTDPKKRLFVNLNTFFNYSNKYLLAGTLKNGIWVYNIDKKRQFFIKDLPSLNITAIKVIDDKVFIGSDFGFWHIPINYILR